jgi:hypothetical protein
MSDPSDGDFGEISETTPGGILAALNSVGTAGILMRINETQRELEEKKAKESRIISDLPRAIPEPTPGTTKALLRAELTKLDAAEYRGDAFSEGMVMRADWISLFRQITVALVVIIAVKHTEKIASPVFSSIYVQVLLVFVTLCLSALGYQFAHWQKAIALVRRSRTRSGGDADVDAAGTDAQLEKEATETLWHVRMSAGETVISALKDPLYLITNFITYILVAIILAHINAGFSDGQWIVPKVAVLAEFVLVVFVDFTSTGYRREMVARTIHLSS